MAKLIRIDRKLARRGGKLVLDTNGAPCCCDTTQLFWKLTACDCSGGSTRFWSDTYRPSMGCVWAEIEGRCYYICPDSESRETLPPLGQNKRPTFFSATSKEEACRICCGYGASDCCDLNPGRCGRLADEFPLVELQVRPLAVSLEWQEYLRCGTGACNTYTHVWNQPWTARTARQDAGILCVGETANAEGRTTEQRTKPCQTQADTWTNEIVSRGRFSLVASSGYDAGLDIGYNDGRDAVVGTARYVGGAAVAGDFDIYGGWFGRAGGGIVKFAISLNDPTLWWARIQHANFAGPEPQLTASATVSVPGRCQPSVVLDYTYEGSTLQACGTGSSRVYERSSGLVAFDFRGIASCLDTGDGAGGIDPNNILPVSGGIGAGGLGPAERAILDQQFRGGGCVGCGEGFSG